MFVFFGALNILINTFAYSNMGYKKVKKVSSSLLARGKPTPSILLDRYVVTAEIQAVRLLLLLKPQKNPSIYE